MSRELREEARRREAERAALARRRDEFSRDLRLLAERPEGVRFFRWLLDQGGLFAEEYLPGHPGAYRAGQKSVSLRLWRLLRENLSAEAFAGVVLGADEDVAEGPETEPYPSSPVDWA